MQFNPFEKYVGGFSPNDGTIDFYLRINSLIDEDSVVLDLGAGRAAWFEDDQCKVRHAIRTLKGKARCVIAADVDDAVMQNRASDRQMVVDHLGLGLEKGSVDLVVADYVLEHVDDVSEMASQVDYVLKEGGWFCARTPHKYNYVALVARLIRNSRHSKFLQYIQPGRKEVDVFPTVYKINTLKDVNKYFHGWNSYSYISRTDPSYYFGNRFFYYFLSTVHRLFHAEFSGNLYVFLQKRPR